MRPSRSVIGYIESSMDSNPFCACGAQMIPVEHDGALYLECARHDQDDRGLVARIWSLFGHDRKLLLAPEELAA
jgi:hypothetical protein